MIPNCRGISKRVSEARDGGPKLTALERLHLLYCLACRRFRKQLDLIGRAAAAEPKAGPGLSPEAKARMKKSLQG